MRYGWPAVVSIECVMYSGVKNIDTHGAMAGFVYTIVATGEHIVSSGDSIRIVKLKAGDRLKNVRWVIGKMCRGYKELEKTIKGS